MDLRLPALFLLMTTLAVPSAQASCHSCAEAVLTTCSGLKPTDCADSAVHLATHAPALALEAARDPKVLICLVTGDACKE